MNLTELLQHHFGFSTFRNGQEEVISRILSGDSSLAVFPTGSGKSLCYQLPALVLDGLTLVVSPLIALMKDQVESLQSRGVRAERLDSSLSSEEVISVYRDMQSGAVKILFVAPERFTNPNFLNRLKQVNISLLAVDEAHCISEWGHAFRPDYLKIARAAKELGITTQLALTATATPIVSEDICKSFGIKAENHIQTGFKRSNLTLRATVVQAVKRDEVLLERLSKHVGESTIVYVTRQMTTEHLTTFLRKKAGLLVRSYHAGMSTEKRDEIQEEFMSGKCHVIIATIAFGMGIDKADIRHVYHYNLPKSFENYVQETGRAGRDGVPSDCEVLACEDDLCVLENFVYAKRPSIHAIDSLVSSCLGSSGEVVLNRYNLSIAHDIKTEVIQTILVWLELGGYVISKGWRYGSYQVNLLRTFDDILLGHSDARQAFLKELFDVGEVGVRNKNKIIFDVAQVSQVMREPQSKIVQALQWLETQGDLSLKPSQYLMVYEATTQGVNASSKVVVAKVEKHFEQWEKAELSRLQNVVDLVESGTCIEQRVLSYFGEVSGDCGKCSSCSPKNDILPLKNSARVEVETRDLEIIKQVSSERHIALSAPRQMARFLCGLTSPATTKARLTTKHDQFGVFSERSFSDILECCEVLM